MDLNLLRVLNAVLETGSVSSAARSLGLSASATSHALARLREEVGDDLVVRVGNGMRPTPRGEALAARLRPALAVLEEALQPIGFDPSTSRREFRVSMVDYASLVLLPGLSARLAQEAPGVSLRVPPAAAGQVGSLLGEEGGRYGEARLDLVIGVFGEEADRTDLLGRTLWEDRLVCVLRRGHRAAERWSLETYLQLVHLQIAPRGLPGGPLDERLAGLGLRRRVQIAAPHFLAIPFAVAAGEMVSTLPERVAHQLAGPLGLQILPLPLEVGPFRIQALWHRRQAEDAGLTWFRAQLQAVVDAGCPAAR